MFAFFCTEPGDTKELEQRFGLPREVVRQFNTDGPEAAFSSLELADDSDKVDFILGNPGISTLVLGDYLGDPRQEKILQAYISKLNLADLSLDAGLRLLLAGFRLPGEAQKIDRIMEAFAKHWASHQNECKPDVAHTVAFALVMLNTDLHNPAVQKKMSFIEFQRNLRGLDDGNDLPEEWIAEWYDNIKSQEIVLASKFTRLQHLTSPVVGMNATPDVLSTKRLRQIPSISSISTSSSTHSSPAAVVRELDALYPLII